MQINQIVIHFLQHCLVEEKSCLVKYVQPTVYRVSAKDADVCIKLGLFCEESYFNSSKDK